VSGSALRCQLTALLLDRTDISRDVKKKGTHNPQILTIHTGFALSKKDLDWHKYQNFKRAYEITILKNNGSGIFLL
jgi:hypothetical protein